MTTVTIQEGKTSDHQARAANIEKVFMRTFADVAGHEAGVIPLVTRAAFAAAVRAAIEAALSPVPECQTQTRSLQPTRPPSFGEAAPSNSDPDATKDRAALDNTMWTTLADEGIASARVRISKDGFSAIPRPWAPDIEGILCDAAGRQICRPSHFDQSMRIAQWVNSLTWQDGEWRSLVATPEHPPESAWIQVDGVYIDVKPKVPNHPGLWWHRMPGDGRRVYVVHRHDDRLLWGLPSHLAPWNPPVYDGQGGEWCGLVDIQAMDEERIAAIREAAVLREQRDAARKWIASEPEGHNKVSIIRAWLDAGGPMHDPDEGGYTACENLDSAMSVTDPGERRPRQATSEEAWSFLFGRDLDVVWDESAAKALGCAHDKWSQIASAWARSMAVKLAANAHKGGWSDDTPEELVERVQQELDELKSALSKWRSEGSPSDGRRAVQWEAADVANMAMMVSDVVGG